MIDRRDVLVGSATALAASMFTSITAQGTTVPGTKRGFLDRPGCRVYYEVTGSGPPIIFAHGLGSNHLTWWQQVPHFSDRYTCVTFAHRGYPPSSEIGVPDPRDFAGDLAALIEHLQLAAPGSPTWPGPHFAPSGAPPLGQNTETNVSFASQLTEPSACTARRGDPAGPEYGLAPTFLPRLDELTRV